MGLTIHTIAKIPDYWDKDFFVYLLDYGFKEPLSDALRHHFDEMADWASRNNSVVIQGSAGSHFNDEVFSWHKINGLPGDEVLPAILISTINPSVFNQFGEGHPGRYKPTDKMVLIPLRKVVKTSEDLYPILKRVLRELSEGKKLSRLTAVKESKGKTIGRTILDSILLKPSVHGVGVDIKSLFGKSDR
jgi:hypothetical protein